MVVRHARFPTYLSSVRALDAAAGRSGEGPQLTPRDATPPVHPRITRRYRIASVGLPAQCLLRILDALRLRADVDVLELASPLGLAELLAFRRIDLLLVDQAEPGTSLVRVLQAALPAGKQPAPRIWLCGPDAALAALQVDSWIDAALGSPRRRRACAEEPGTTPGHWADGVRDRPKGARSFLA